MTVKLVLEFSSPELAADALRRLAPENAAAPAKQGAEASVTAAALTHHAAFAEPPETKSAAAAPVSPPAEAPKRRGRKPRAVVDAAKQAAEASAELAEQMQPADSAPVSKDAAFEAFKKLHEKRGMEVCWTVLQRNGAKRFSEVPESAYPRFVQDCKDAIDGKDLTAAA